MALSDNPDVIPDAAPPAQDAQAENVEDLNGDDGLPHIVNVTLKLPHEPFETKLQIHTQEQVQDVRQSIIDQQYAMQYTCFHLEHNGERISDYIELSDVPNLQSGSTISLVEDPYTEKEARLHIIRVRELIGAAGERSDAAYGISAGASLLDAVTDGSLAAPETSLDDVSNYSFESSASVKSVLPVHILSPKTIKSLSLSPWNPPPYHLKNKGHLMYLVVVNLDGEQFHITSHLSGFYVNRSSHNKFDPSPKAGPKTYKSHSLLTLIRDIDPRFNPAFQELLEHNSKREPLSMFLLTNSMPANPWLISPDSTTLVEHKPDITRTQESFLFGGTENNESLRDWNEEFQTTRELPGDGITDKIFRERLTSKLFADFTEAAVKGAVLVAHNELTPLNPTEEPDAQIFVYNNVFFSFGADGVGTFATEGGDHAARIATRKDANGVRAVNQLDIPGLFTAATAIVDYCGRRIVGQSIVPGIFKQREPGDSIDYGAVEGKDIIAAKPEFVEPFKKLSEAFFVKPHPVWDKDGKRYDLEASVDTKGLLGTDARKYVLDLYRLTPLDVAWIEQHWGATPEEREDKSKDYPHRMAVLRLELVNAYRLHKLRERLSGEAQDKSASEGDATNGDSKDSAKATEKANGDSEDAAENDATEGEPAVLKNHEDFTFSLNPDVFSGQCPQTEEEKEQMAKDEAEVRAVCKYLTSYIIPTLLQQIEEGDLTFPLDGASLTSMLHKRGINVRYLGHIASKPDKDNHRLQSLRRLAVQEMVARAFKHVAGAYLKQIPHPLASACAAHLLNCLLGTRLNPEPVVETDEAIKSIYSSGTYDFETVSPEAFRASLVDEVRRRFRFDVEGDLVQPGREMQLLREIALKLGLQLASRDYRFEPFADVEPAANAANGNGTAGKKKRKGKDSPSPTRADQVSRAIQTFHADDVVNFVPLVRDSAPKSNLAEEAFEAGRLSLAQNQKDMGLELIMESLNLHDQIYGIIHPEVARMYLAISNVYFSLDDKPMAFDLARKSVIIAERTLGLDASETVLAYLNLGLLEHARGHSAVALRFVLHALELSKTAYGADHPEAVTMVTNGALMLQSLRRYHESRLWFEAAARLSDAAHAGQPATTAAAQLLFQLAQALALDRDSSGAVRRMRESRQMFEALLGPDDKSTREADTWLQSLTTNAVSVARRQKDIASGKLRKLNLFANGLAGSGGARKLGGAASSAAGTGPAAAAAGAAAAAAAGTGVARGEYAVDMRNIDDLIKYIDGDDAKKKDGRKKRSNPRRRGGATMMAA